MATTRLVTYVPPPTGIYPFITTIWHAFNQSINVIWGMFAHSSTIVVLGPLTVFGGCSRPWICLLIMSQQCSIGFRSGEQAGQSMASMPSSPRQSIETPAVCGRALSCIQINAHCSRKRPCNRFQYFARSKNVQLCTTPSTDISWTLDILFLTKYTTMWYNGQLCIAWNTPHKYCVLAYKLFMVLPANLSYNLAIIFPVFRELLVNVLNNYCFLYRKYAFGKKKYIKIKKKYIYIYIYINIYGIYINDGLHFAHCLHYKLGQVSAGDMSGFKPASQWSEVAGLPRPPNWQLKVSIQVIW